MLMPRMCTAGGGVLPGRRPEGTCFSECRCRVEDPAHLPAARIGDRPGAFGRTEYLVHDPHAKGPLIRRGGLRRAGPPAVLGNEHAQLLEPLHRICGAPDDGGAGNPGNPLGTFPADFPGLETGPELVDKVVRQGVLLRASGCGRPRQPVVLTVERIQALKAIRPGRGGSRTPATGSARSMAARSSDSRPSARAFRCVLTHDPKDTSARSWQVTRGSLPAASRNARKSVKRCCHCSSRVTTGTPFTSSPEPQSPGPRGVQADTA